MTAVIVLAGGASRRWGGVDKTAADLDGRPVLARTVDGVPAGLAVVVVGPAGHPFADLADPGRVRWTREDPPGGGPVAGLAAGLAVLPVEAADGADQVVLLAGDQPGGGSAVPRLLEALHRPAGGAPVDAAVGVDPGGRRQPLLAAYQVPALLVALDRLATGGAEGGGTGGGTGGAAGGGTGGGAPGSLGGRSLRDLLTLLRVVEVPVTRAEAFDLDTPGDLDTLRAARRRPG